MDAVGQAPGGANTMEAPIAAYPNFEHMEAEGQRLLPEQLKTMLKALARSNLLRGDAGYGLFGVSRPLLLPCPRRACVPWEQKLASTSILPPGRLDVVWIGRLR
jgi:hypothetical protein